MVEGEGFIGMDRDWDRRKATRFLEEGIVNDSFDRKKKGKFEGRIFQMENDGGKRRSTVDGVVKTKMEKSGTIEFSLMTN